MLLRISSCKAKGSPVHEPSACSALTCVYDMPLYGVLGLNSTPLRHAPELYGGVKRTRAALVGVGVCGVVGRAMWEQLDHHRQGCGQRVARYPPEADLELPVYYVCTSNYWCEYAGAAADNDAAGCCCCNCCCCCNGHPNLIEVAWWT